MRTLILLRGAPGCGKSTWLEKNNLSQYSLSADSIRLMVSSPELDINGNVGISQKDNPFVWNLLFELLEKRMQNGEFTIIDATNAKKSDMQKYKPLAEKYRYRIFCIDMTDVPIDVCKKQNAMRSEYKKVPEYVIDKQYETFKTQKVPSGITVIKKEDFNQILFSPIDFSKYEAVHIFGDVHGCLDPLNKYLKDGIKENELYIFCGDYLDRGIQNVEVLKFMMSIINKENVILIEGNHEKHLWKWARGEQVRSYVFDSETRLQLEAAKINKKDVRRFCRQLSQCAYFKYDDNYFVATHGGINQKPTTFISTNQIISGVGTYKDSNDVDNAFFDNTPSNYYSIHGHRNVTDSPISVNDRVFNLENSVELGGNLRVVKVSHKNGIETFEIPNDIYKKIDFGKLNKVVPTNDIEKVIIAMRSTNLIKEKKFENISSFNFTRNAFRNNSWTDATVKARGLFINTKNNKIVARGYEKFFRINERPETEFNGLKRTLKFPLTAYVKENGYLGILGYDEELDEMFIASKTTPIGPYADWFRDLLFKSLSKEKQIELKEYLKNNNKGMVFEVIETKNDPHIIEYDNNQIILLDVIDRKITFDKLSYEELVKIGSKFGFKTKKKAFTLTTWKQFENWYNEVSDKNYKYNGNYIEGFVIEDSKGFLFKLKSYYYNLWKYMRSVSQSVLTYGYYRHESKLTEIIQKEYYEWLKNKYKMLPSNTDIITLRKMFYQEKE